LILASIIAIVFLVELMPDRRARQLEGLKMKIAALSFVGCLVASAALATTDDVRVVNQCVADSAGYAVSEKIKIMYCTCMVGKMSENETRSVSQFEEANPRMRDDCAKRAGWDH